MPIDFDGTLGISATGNITGSYLIGNGSQLTGLPSGYTNTDASNYLNGNITTSIIPNGASQTLGNAANPWQSLYVSNATIYIDSVPVTVTTGNVLQVDGANVLTSNPDGNLTVSNFTATGNVAAVNIAGSLTTASQPNITSVGTLTSLSATGTSVINNLSVTGNVNIPGNINQVNGNSAQFFGDAAGFGALYAGITSGYANLADTVIQASANYNEFAQVNLQNINTGAAASADFVATADTGSNDLYYVNMGIASSTFNGLSANALGNVISPNDAYLYTLGNTGNAIGGNLVIAAGTADKLIKIAVGGGTTSDVVATVSNTGIAVTGQVSATTMSVSGTITAGNINANVSGTITNAINVTGNAQPNITSVGTLSSLAVSGNIAGSNLLVNNNAVITGNLTVNGTTTTVNSNTVTINDKFINVANNASTSAQADGGGLGVGPVGGEYASLSFNNGTTSWDTNIPLSVTGTVSATNLTGSLTTAAQPNVTSVGTLTSLSSSGNVTANYFLGNGSALTGVVATGIGTLSTLSVSGTATIGQIAGNGNTISNIQGANVSGAVASATTATTATSATSATTATTAGTVTTAAQGNITSVGTLSALTVAGNTFVTGGFFRLPSYTTTQISALTGMVGGEMVYNTTLSVVQGYQLNPATSSMGWVSWTVATYQ